MSHSNARRITAWSGLLGVVLTLVAFLAFTKSGYPDSNDRPAKIAAYFLGHRDAALTQQFLLGLSMLFLACFMGGLVYLIWQDEDSRLLAIIAAIGAAASIGTFTAGVATQTLLAYSPPVGDPSLLRAEMTGTFITWNASGFMFAVFIGAAAFAAWRTHVLPAWVGEVGMVAAVLQLVGAAAVAQGDGAFSPQGWVSLVAALSVQVWVLSACFALWRPSEVASAAPSAPAPA